MGDNFKVLKQCTLLLCAPCVFLLTACDGFLGSNEINSVPLFFSPEVKLPDAPAPTATPAASPSATPAGTPTSQVSDYICSPAQICYYIDSSLGDDQNSGLSRSLPWRTLAKVNASTFLPGNAILFRAGQTFSGQLTLPSSGTAANPLVISSYEAGNRPLITGGTYGVYGLNVSFISISNLKITNVSQGIFGKNTNHHWKISNCWISNFTTCGIHSMSVASPSAATEGWIVQNNYIGFSTAPAVISYDKTGIRLAGMSAPLVTHNIIETGTVEAIRIDDLSALGSCSSPVVSYNEIRDNYTGIGIVGCPNSIVTHNWIHDGHGYGIGIGGWSNASVEHRSTNALVTYNLIQNMSISHDNVDYNGIDINGGCTDGKIYHNTVENIAFHSLTFEGDNNTPSTGWDVRNNILDSRRQINNQFASGVFFHQTLPSTQTFVSNIIYANAHFPTYIADYNATNHGDVFYTLTTFPAHVLTQSMLYNVDPGFTNSGTGDLSLLPDSVAIGMGASIKGIGQVNLDLGALPQGKKSVFDF